VTSDDGSTSISHIPKFEDALKELYRHACKTGVPREKIRSWLNSDNTLIRLIEKEENWWFPEIPEGIGSDAVALHFVERGCHLGRVPAHLRSYRVDLAATSGPYSTPNSLFWVPAEHLTPKLMGDAMIRHPYVMDDTIIQHPSAINTLVSVINKLVIEREKITVDLYESVGQVFDFYTFRSLRVSKEMAANDRYQAVLEQLRERENSLIREASLKDPSAAINSFVLEHTGRTLAELTLAELTHAELTLDIDSRRGKAVDVDKFTRRYVPEEVTEQPQFKALLEGLQKKAHSGLDSGDRPRQGDGKRAEPPSRMEWDYGDGNGGGGGGGGGPTHAAPSRDAVASASYASSRGLVAKRRRVGGPGRSSS
jgi:hypothetical protein